MVDAAVHLFPRLLRSPEHGERGRDLWADHV